MPASQSLTVLSSDADASSLPSGEKATALTLIRMALERLQRRSRAGVPEPDRLVARCRRQQLAVRREGHGVDPIRMALERRQTGRDTSFNEKVSYWLIVGSDCDLKWARNPSLQLLLW